MTVRAVKVPSSYIISKTSLTGDNLQGEICQVENENPLSPRGLGFAKMNIIRSLEFIRYRQ